MKSPIISVPCQTKKRTARAHTVARLCLSLKCAIMQPGVVKTRSARSVNAAAYPSIFAPNGEGTSRLAVPCGRQFQSDTRFVLPVRSQSHLKNLVSTAIARTLVTANASPAITAKASSHERPQREYVKSVNGDFWLNTDSRSTTTIACLPRKMDLAGSAVARRLEFPKRQPTCTWTTTIALTRKTVAVIADCFAMPVTLAWANSRMTRNACWPRLNILRITLVSDWSPRPTLHPFAFRGTSRTPRAPRCRRPTGPPRPSSCARRAWRKCGS